MGPSVWGPPQTHAIPPLRDPPQMHAIEHDAFLASCGAGTQSLLHFALHTRCCDACRTRSIPHLTVKAQHDTHRAAVSCGRGRGCAL